MNGEQSHTIHHTQDSSQSLAVVNGEQSCKAKKFHRAFTSYDLLLRALDASSIYLHDFQHVAPPKSWEDAHITRGKCEFGGATLNNPSLGFSYVLPRLLVPGGVRSSPKVPSHISHETRHFINRNITGLTIAMKKITGSINIIIPGLTPPTLMSLKRCSPHDRQSSHTSFTVTATLYIQVTQILKLRVETASPYKGHTSRTFFV